MNFGYMKMDWILGPEVHSFFYMSEEIDNHTPVFLLLELNVSVAIIDNQLTF